MTSIRLCSPLAAALALCIPFSAQAQQAGAGAVVLNGPGASATEDFNTLSNSHNQTSSALPSGWYFLEVGNSNANNTYLVDDGSSNSGNTFSYGVQGEIDRALGALASGSVVSTVGAKLENNSGSLLTELVVNFYVEQWRLGDLNGADALEFAYSTDATSLNSGTWTSVAALNATSPVTTGTAATKLNGNLADNRAAISATIPGLNVAQGESFWIRWSDKNDLGVDDALAIDDVVFGAAVDVPPSLTASYPANGATDFPATASLKLTFSEAVQTSGNWFNLNCSVSGVHNEANTAVSGGPSEYFLTPAAALTVAETCVLTLDPALITDLGANAYPLNPAAAISFTVAAPPPNVPPSIVSTVPTSGATNFAAAGDLKVTFSEPVITAAGAFALSCTNSTGIALAAGSTDGGVNFTITTGTALLAGDTCVFDIKKNFIQDIEGALLDADATIHFTVMDVADTSAYYQNVNLASPATLRCSIYETIKDHVKYPYTSGSTDTWDILELADQDPVDQSKILDLFKNESYTKIGGGTGVYNREHTWPRSLGLGATSTNGPATDTHMLHLTNTDYNSSRGNRPFGNCDSGCTKLPTTFNHGIGGSSDADSNWVQAPDGNTGTFEPWDHIKGNMARAVMYMATRYQGQGGEPHLELTDNRSLITQNGSGGKHYMGLLTDLLQWNNFDLPDASEHLRNELVFSFQENRNPFVDHPEWARRELFETAISLPCSTNVNAPVAGPDSYTTALNTQLTVTPANGVLANDTDVEFAAAGNIANWFKLSAERLTQPSNGSVALASDGSLIYVPNAGFCGTDSFTYVTSDGTRTSAPATVTILVNQCTVVVNEIFADGFED